MYLIIFALLAAAAAAASVHLTAKREALPVRIAETFLVYWFAVAIGASGVFAFAGHAFRADQVAASIGWAAKNPFQQEVAFADLALGILGLTCIFLRDNFWIATAVAVTVMYWGDALVHINQLLFHGNHNSGNAGAILWGTITVPAITIVLFRWHSRALRQKREPVTANAAQQRQQPGS